MTDEQLAAEHRSRGWLSIPDSAPQWARDRIIALRRADLEGKITRRNARSASAAEYQAPGTGATPKASRVATRPANDDLLRLRLALASL